MENENNMFSIKIINKKKLTINSRNSSSVTRDIDSIGTKNKKAYTWRKL